ncbi:MAG: hypothetical protein ACPKPY_03020 [Nitrososphaeraceae archaeon]
MSLNSNTAASVFLNGDIVSKYMKIATRELETQFNRKQFIEKKK